jgi:hypothetical protein
MKEWFQIDINTGSKWKVNNLRLQFRVPRAYKCILYNIPSLIIPKVHILQT